MKKVKPIAVLFLLTISCFSCLDEYRGDDPNTVTTLNLTGKWKYIDNNENADSLVRIPTLCSTYDLTMEIIENGTGETCELMQVPTLVDIEVSGNLTWYMKRDTLFWNIKAETNRNQKFTIEVLDEENLVLSEH